MDYALKGELTILRKKYEVLKKENSMLRAELSKYKQEESKIKQKMFRYDQLYSSIDHIMDGNNFMDNVFDEEVDKINSVDSHTTEINLRIISDMIKQNYNFEIFRRYCDYEQIFDKFASVFVKRHPIKMAKLLRNVEQRKIKDKKVIDFYNKFVKE